MVINIKKLNDNAVIPAYANIGDAGMDLTATSKEVDIYNRCISYGVGLAFEIPEGYVGLIFPRSSIYKTGLDMTNSVGVVDSGYRGEVKAKFYYENINDESKFYNVGDRIAQIIIVPYPQITFNVVDSLSKTTRGDGGFGSSGK